MCGMQFERRDASHRMGLMQYASVVVELAWIRAEEVTIQYYYMVCGPLC